MKRPHKALLRGLLGLALLGAVLALADPARVKLMSLLFTCGEPCTTGSLAAAVLMASCATPPTSTADVSPESATTPSASPTSGVVVLQGSALEDRPRVRCEGRQQPLPVGRHGCSHDHEVVLVVRGGVRLVLVG